MKQVYDNLFVGDANDADNQRKHDNNDIKYVLNLSDKDPGADTSCFHIPIADDGSNSDFMIHRVLELAQKIHQKAEEEDVSLLVHCSVGTSRSVAVSASLMSLKNGKRVRENVNRIKKVRSSANPHPELLKQVSRITADIYSK